MSILICRPVLVLLILLAFCSSVAAADGEIKFVNSSSVYTRFYIDEQAAGACPPGDYVFAVATLGPHKLKAVNPKGQYLVRDINLTSNGYVWTITD